MKYFVPDIRVNEDLDSQDSYQDKFGGLPWGLEESRWPFCSECKKPQTFLAQFQHDSNRLDLGKEGRVIFIFQCNHFPGMCSTWEGGSGANACFILEQEELVGALSKSPRENTLIENEVRVVDWLEHDDGISDSNAPAFFDEELYFELSDDIVESVSTGTKLGSVPEWIQSPSEAPVGDWEFIGQLDSTHSFIHPPRKNIAWVVEDGECWEGRTHYGEGPNYGDGGIAYLFVKKTDAVPKGWFFWQCG
ncbi:hypothetical protein [Pleionea litopenaei]|uniref:DUF1963 domain-containing protein n=1 Tax=Pleionea litopenaei TaxID=3070815 RepID=A0AA51RS51_9GAMM|nr:hypothetical protein [Pleionea sp. HL-JVS1]WMS86595.1 hypothetical protein Q9312_15345 [Pleionea sp. HL-JVS1]